MVIRSDSERVFPKTYFTFGLFALHIHMNSICHMYVFMCISVGVLHEVVNVNCV